MNKILLTVIVLIYITIAPAALTLLVATIAPSLGMTIAGALGLVGSIYAGIKVGGAYDDYKTLGKKPW